MKNEKRKYIHSIKGPITLSPEMVKDICDNRTIKDAQNVLAAKHGVSVNRIRKVWAAYYGGTTLAAAKDGLKKPLPTKPQLQTDVNLRSLKTERAQYQAPAPRTIKAARAQDTGKAVPTRKIVVVKKGEADLELDKESLAQMDDEQAELLAGEAAAGNNSDLLREAINALVLTNKNLSSVTRKHLRAAYNANGKKNSGGYIESDIDNIDETSNDTETEDDTSNSCAVDEPSADDNIDSEGDRGDISPGPYEGRGATNGLVEIGRQVFANNNTADNISRYSNIRGGSTTECVGSANGQYTTLQQRAASGVGARTQPIFINGRETGPQTGSLQKYNFQTRGSESPISAAQHHQGKNGIQQNYSRYDDQLSTGARQGDGLYSTSGNGSSKTVAGIPWLRPRPV